MARTHKPHRSLRLPVLLGVALLAMALTAATAIASGGSIGPVKLTGQVTATLKESLAIKEQADGVTIPAVGCQVQQSSTPQVLLHFPSPVMVTLNGHKTKVDVAIISSAEKLGDTEKIAASGANVTLQVSVGTKVSQWSSTSGTLEIKDKGLAGSFEVGMVPFGKAPGGTPVQSGGATKDVKLSGSWTTCRAFPQ